jgi:hypothetical protein
LGLLGSERCSHLWQSLDGYTRCGLWSYLTSSTPDCLIHVVTRVMKSTLLPSLPSQLRKPLSLAAPVKHYPLFSSILISITTETTACPRLIYYRLPAEKTHCARECGVPCSLFSHHQRCVIQRTHLAMGVE